MLFKPNYYLRIAYQHRRFFGSSTVNHAGDLIEARAYQSDAAFATIKFQILRLLISYFARPNHTTVFKSGRGSHPQSPFTNMILPLIINIIWQKLLFFMFCNAFNNPLKLAHVLDNQAMTLLALILQFQGTTIHFIDFSNQLLQIFSLPLHLFFKLRKKSFILGQLLQFPLPSLMLSFNLSLHSGFQFINLPSPLCYFQERILLKFDDKLLNFLKRDFCYNLFPQIANGCPKLLQFSPLCFSQYFITQLSYLQLKTIRFGWKLGLQENILLARLLTLLRSVVYIDEIGKINLIKAMTGVFLHFKATNVITQFSIQSTAHIFLSLIYHGLNNCFNFLYHDPVHALRPLQFCHSLLQFIYLCTGNCIDLLCDESEYIGH